MIFDKYDKDKTIKKNSFIGMAVEIAPKVVPNLFQDRIQTVDLKTQKPEK